MIDTISKLDFDLDGHVGIAILDERWMSEAVFRPLCLRAIAAARAQLRHHKNAELSIALMDDDGIRTLNQQYRGQDKPTNVLSFPAPDHPDHPADLDVLTQGALLLGDIVLSFDTVTREAKTGGISFDDHLIHLLIHGYYHLCGFDHVDEGEAQKMEGLEVLALADLGITNPYDKETYCER